jgi:signal transduction histidine kinase
MLLAAGTALVAVVLLAIPLGILAGRYYLRDERLELQQAAATAAAETHGEPGSLPQQLDLPEILIAAYDRHGRRLSGIGPANGGPIVHAALRGQEASSTTGSAIMVSAPVSDGDHVVEALLLTTSLKDVDTRTRNAWLALAGMGVCAVVVSALGARIVAGRLTRPVDRLTAVAQRIGAGDLGARTEVSGVAELDTLGATLNASVQRLAETVERERSFSAEVSHQLRTPLSALRLELERAEGLANASTATDGTAAVAAALRGAQEAADRLDVTITEVISLARDLPPATRDLTIDHLLASVDERWCPALAAHSRPLRVDREPGIPANVALTHAAGAQILDVLIDNAAVHGRGAVTVRAHSTGGMVAIDVSDEGPPLEREAHELFARRNGTDRGIGLPYARKLAAAEGARLTLAANAPPTFRLLIRIADEVTVNPHQEGVSDRPGDRSSR